MTGKVEGRTAHGSKPRRIGVLLVHGIGEQRRFEHLNGQGRQIVRAIMERIGAGNVTVDIEGGRIAALHADQDTWAAGPTAPVKVFVGAGGNLTHVIDLHEVWWADVNESYSLAKQFRFWLWGLSVWAYPVGKGRRLHGAVAMASPQIASNGDGLSTMLWMRLRLFMVGVFFVVGGFSVGFLLALVQRLLNLRTPPLLRTLTNYLSGVKLFNQRRRFGAPLGLGNDDFLDNLDQPPRVSVRRRVIRSLATMARSDYDRWYVVAHSQGTVPAFNGLMETPYAWPGYFDEKGWRELCDAGFGGPGDVPASDAPMLPPRPAWARKDEVAYRRRIFRDFAGFLTLGSPIEKFAAIWPARVPIARIPAFSPDVVWMNVFDPLDPVSGQLAAFKRQAPCQCPHPVDIGYASSPVLLKAHLDYLKWTGPGCLAEGVAGWLLDEGTDGIREGRGRFPHGSTTFEFRRAAAWAWWLAAFVALSATASWMVGRSLARLGATRPDSPKAGLATGVLIVFLSAVLLAATAGVISRALLFQGTLDPEAPEPDVGQVRDVEPGGAP